MSVGDGGTFQSSVDILGWQGGFGKLCSLTSNVWMRKSRPEGLNDSPEATQLVAELSLKPRPYEARPGPFISSTAASSKTVQEKMFIAQI